MENRDLRIRILEVEGGGYLRQGKYDLAEQRFREQYELLLRIQKEGNVRIHKGSPLHNLGISLLFQGKTDQAIRFVALAYVEDLISSKQKTDTDLLPASRVLRGLCGAIWEDLCPIENTVFEIKEERRIFSPQEVETQISAQITLIQENYKKYLKFTWQLEMVGQKGIEQKDFDKAMKSYQDWLSLLYEYQKERKKRVHKGHVLFNLGLICYWRNEISNALDYLLQAHVENVISSRVSAHIRETSSFKVLMRLGVGLDFLDKLTLWVQNEKEKREDVSLPKNLKKRFFSEEKITPPKKAEPTKEIKLETVEKATSAKRTIDELPGSYTERVFIGGAYRNNHLEKLREIAQCVQKLGYYPVIAIDYDPPRDDNGQVLLNIHDFDVLLIHTCRYAIFELSKAAGQYNEIEWSIRFLRKRTLGICQKGKESEISTLVRDLFIEIGEDIFYYSSPSSMKDYIRSKLPQR